eukprot:492137-Pelagomonas_calceolata.AAC.12
MKAGNQGACAQGFVAPPYKQDHLHLQPCNLVHARTHQVLLLPELVIKHSLGLRGHSVLEWVDADAGVDALRGLSCHLGLGAAEECVCARVGPGGRREGRFRHWIPREGGPGEAFPSWIGQQKVIEVSGRGNTLKAHLPAELFAMAECSCQ